jgi:hypothetical protein
MSRPLVLMAFICALLLSACGREGSPTAPSSTSFLIGRWSGTVTVQVNPGDPGAQPPTSGAMTWTFELVPDTNQQTFRATVRAQHEWLAQEFLGTTAITPGNTPPVQISTQGNYASPRGCRGTFGSFGTAAATRIDADFTGVDCDHATFAGHVTLTKQ